jgi:hypothetical protein
MEINVKETPLSEIDLSKIDYEKSYVHLKIGGGYPNMEFKIYVIDINAHKDSAIIKTNSLCQFYWFNLDGTPIRDDRFSLHLFYKEARNCNNCNNFIPFDGNKIGICTRQATCNSQSTWQPKKAVNLHPIIVEYEDLGDTVKILKIEGVMNSDEIYAHAGKDTAKKYFNGYPNMYFLKQNVGNIFINVREHKYSSRILEIGGTIPKQSLFDVVDLIKLSTKRLASLIKDKKPEIKRIVI